MDSGTSSHATNDLKNLSLYSDFGRTNELLVADGSGLTIKHSGLTILSGKPKPILLSHALHEHEL